MSERFERVKEHFRKHKTLYLCSLTGLGVAGITYTIMRRNDLLGDCGYSQREGQLVDTRSPQAIISSSLLNSCNTTTNNYGETKPLSKIVADLANDRWWISQADAARELGESQRNISQHLNHDRKLSGPNSDIQLFRMGVAS